MKTQAAISQHHFFLKKNIGYQLKASSNIRHGKQMNITVTSAGHLTCSCHLPPQIQRSMNDQTCNLLALKTIISVLTEGEEGKLLRKFCCLGLFVTQLPTRS